MSYKRITDFPPPRGIVVETMIADEDGVRNVQDLKLGTSNNLWWHPDGKMYVYYTPTHWKHK